MALFGAGSCVDWFGHWRQPGRGRAHGRGVGGEYGGHRTRVRGAAAQFILLGSFLGGFLFRVVPLGAGLLTDVCPSLVLRWRGG